MAVTVGLDIGSYAIKLVGLDHQGGKFVVRSLGSAYNPVGQVLPKEEAGTVQLAETIKKLLAEQKVLGQPVFLALPETEAFTSVVTMPILTDAELSSAIQWEAEQHIPVSLDEVNLEYTVLRRPPKGSGEEKMTVLLAAASKSRVNQLVTLMERVGVEPAGLETSLIALSRVFSAKTNQSGATVITNISALSTDLVIIDDGFIVTTHSVPTGGLALTRAVEKSLGLDPSHAEEYKRSYGLMENQLEGKVRNSLLPVFNSLVGEVRKTIQYFRSERPETNLKSVIVTGGGAYLPGIVAFLANSLSVEVAIGNPFEAMEVRSGSAFSQEVATFAIATGLAMKTVE
ncbi:hypothetical protein A3A66_02200 [Microgenomates group bacterium RIFCSPLOWO2_01_FULL_46_13]|nr:MAG: hypothetical protein A2783_01970 [Microgenomates group bacterium RIFCSPHIGHO2_01_FULL_45_11]OGV94788.1 MAG: hypothetical protein A3A66_02200 [Microgenomates group bacterium RIFCSPLOWO2_01_FULL_46_13]